jgi:peptidoglycan hydrolase-like amidase
MFRKILLCVLAFGLLIAPISSVHADELLEIERQLEELKKARELSENATKPLESRVSALEKTLDSVRASISLVEKKVKQKQLELEELRKEISENEETMAQQQNEFQTRLSAFYISSRTASPMYAMFSEEQNMSALVRRMAYREAVLEEEKRYLLGVGAQISSLYEDKQLAERLAKELENEKSRLASVKQKTETESKFLEGEIAKAKEYQKQLAGKIAELSARQQSILAARSGSFTSAVGDVPLTDDPNAGPGFDPGFSPAYAGFSFGAYTHRKGMSQYGAKGRAEAGKSANEILQFYYGKTPSEVDTGGTISVQGHGDLNFEDYYLLGIAEMPGSFPKEALKAQAIAARTYALRYKREGKSICTTQSCQVFLKSKADNPPQAWRDAVKETRGQVIEGVVTFYSSTSGGWQEGSGWDTECGDQSCWPSAAFESKGKSPWFYKGWYTESYLNNSAKCGRNHPWLNQEEFADIVNAWIVRKNGGNSDRVLPITIASCGINGVSGNPFSMSEMRDEANRFGGAVTSVSSVSVSYGSNGRTVQVKLVTNRGELSISGDEFRETFNLRAPGYISLRSPLYNIEKK